MLKELHLTSQRLKGQYKTEIMKCHLGGINEVCSKSFRSGVAEQQCIGHVRCCLSNLAAWPLVTEAILFHVNRMFLSVIITSFVIESIVVSGLVRSR
jgi:hypothetical protein